MRRQWFLCPCPVWLAGQPPGDACARPSEAGLPTPVTARGAARRGAACVLALSLCVQGCNALDRLNPPPREPARMTAISGDLATVTAPDTVIALVVKVWEPGGSAASGVAVGFALADSARSLGVRLLVGSDTAGRDSLTVSTSSGGIATVLVHAGCVPGRAVVRLSVTSLRLTDSAVYVLTGAPAWTVTSPRDTAVFPGDTFVIAARGVAPGGRPTSCGTASFTSPDPGVATVTAGGLVRAVGAGRVSISVLGAGGPASVGVAVVPDDTIGAVTYGVGLVLFQLSGDGYRLVQRFADPEHTRAPRWAPSGDRLVCESSTDGGWHYRVYTVGLDGAFRRLLPTDTVASEYNASYSADGAWVYFTAQPDPTDTSTEIWRVHANGSGPERMGPPSTPDPSDFASPSPDGSRVAFVRSSHIQVLDVATGSVTDLHLAGKAPRWSPTGDLIAYVNNGVVYVVRPDGSNQTELSDPSKTIGAWLDWSPDGQWVVATSWFPEDGVTELLNAYTGKTLRLAFKNQGYAWPAWKP